MSISSREIRRIITPLRLIFWGGLICVLDFKINEFDLLNDFVGMIMITWGVIEVSKVKVHDHYSMAMLFVKILAVLTSLQALQEHFTYRIPEFLSVMLYVIGAASMLATVVFCVAMLWLSSEATLQRSVRSWKTTTILFSVIYLIPLGIFYSAAAVAIAIGKTIDIDLGLAGLLILPLLLLPLIHFFVTTSRMKNEAQIRTNSDQRKAALQHGTRA